MHAAVLAADFHTQQSRFPGQRIAAGDFDPVVPITEDIAHIAVAAFERYGKGRAKAGLNFGDCLSYACAKAHGARLLFKGEDFAATDIVRA